MSSTTLRMAISSRWLKQSLKARSAGAQDDIKRVPETVPEANARSAHSKMDQIAPVAEVAELADHDAIIVGTGTRFGRMSSQMAAFLDQAGGLWPRVALNGKVGAAFASTATQHGGQEITLFSIITNLLHFGMTIVGLPYSHQGQMTLSEIVGGAPLMERQPSPAAMARANLPRSNWRAPVTPGRVGRQDGEQAFWLRTDNRVGRRRRFGAASGLESSM